MRRSPLSGVRDILAAARRLLRPAAGRPQKRPVAEIGPYVNRVLSDATLFNQIPSPTERESARTDFILERLADFGYTGSEIDSLGNVTAVVPAREGTDEHVLVFAGVRCDEYSPLESMARLESDRLAGRGVAESAVPVAALLVLAEYLARNQLQYDRNVLFLFTVHDPGELDSPPLEGFLRQWKARLHGAAFVRGLDLGTVGDRPLGTCKLEVRMRTPERDLMGGGLAVSAVTTLSTVAARLGGIRWDQQNTTFLNIAKLEAGLGFGWFPAEGIMELEVFSPDANALDVARNAMVATINGVAAEAGAQADITVRSVLPPGNPDLNAEMSEQLRRVHEKLRIKSRAVSIPTSASILSSQGIPALTLGVAAGRKSATEEYVEISSLELGFRQLLMFVEAAARRPSDE